MIILLWGIVIPLLAITWGKGIEEIANIEIFQSMVGW